MPVPKRKRSHSRIAKSHANKRYKVKAFAECKNCKAVIAPHQVCAECGHYKGIKVIRTKMERSIARGQARQAKEARTQKEAIPAEAEHKE